MQLPINLPFDLLRTRWASILNPVLKIPFLSGIQLDGIQLVSGTPKAINHLLQRKPQGWFLVDKNANANVWRTQPVTDTTIILQSSANVTISLWVY